MERRRCLACAQYLSFSAFSKFQLGEGNLAKCMACMHGVSQAERDERKHAPTAAQTLACRTRNVIRSGAISFDTVLEQGALRSMAIDELSTAKWHRDIPRSYQDDNAPIALGDRGMFRLEAKAAQRALRIIEKWNAARLIDFPVRLHVSQPMRVISAQESERRAASNVANTIATALSGARAQRGPGMPPFENGNPFNPPTEVLVQPRLQRMVKFNSSTGWQGRGEQQAAGAEALAEAEAMEALCHFSYSESGGEILLCGLKGGGGLLSEVVIHSRGQTYGPLDLGADGIRSWFGQHVCNRICKGMARPHDAESIFAPQQQSAVVCPRALPPRVIPPPANAGRGGPRLAHDASACGNVYLDVEAMARERHERQQESSERTLADAKRREKILKAAAADATSNAARAEAEVAAELEWLRRQDGINGITGIIGRQPTTRQRPTTQELIQGRREWPTGSGKWLFEDPQGWMRLEKLEDLMKAPNDGSFFKEPVETDEQALVETGVEREEG